VETPILAGIELSLALLVLCVFADHTHHTVAGDDLALDANLLYRCPNFHCYCPSPRRKIRRGLDFCSASSQPHSASAILRLSIPDGTNGVPLLTEDRPLYHL
jgi:hypothetical protein